MWTDWIQLGWRPVLAGLATLLIAVLAGWGVAGDAAFPPVRWLRRWLNAVIVPALGNRRWLIRAGFIFINNATIAAAVILAARPGGAWTAIVLVGLSMGIAARLLASDEDLIRGLSHATRQPDQPPNSSSPDTVHALSDTWTKIGLMLNLLEVPALVACVALSIGQCAAPTGRTVTEIWAFYAQWLLPLFLLAAAGEGLWIGRLNIEVTPTPATPSSDEE